MASTVDTGSMLQAERAKASFDVDVLMRLLGADKRRAQLTMGGRRRLEPWECHAHSLSCQPDPEQKSGVQGTRVRRLSRAYT